MASVIDDDLLEQFIVAGTWTTVGQAIIDLYHGTATRVVNYFGALTWTEDPHQLRRWKDVTRALATA
jgi:hypothetical protein